MKSLKELVEENGSAAELEIVNKYERLKEEYGVVDKLDIATKNKKRLTKDFVVISVCDAGCCYNSTGIYFNSRTGLYEFLPEEIDWCGSVYDDTIEWWNMISLLDGMNVRTEFVIVCHNGDFVMYDRVLNRVVKNSYNEDF